MKVSKSLSIKHRVVKRYNEKQRFKPSQQTPALGETPYRNLLITGKSNSLRTSLGMAVLVNHVRNNPRLKFGQHAHVYLTNMEAPVGLILWEFINNRSGDEMCVMDDIDKRWYEVYGGIGEIPSEQAMVRQRSEISHQLEEERMVQVIKWFQQRGYKLKVSSYGDDYLNETVSNIRLGRNVIRYSDGVITLERDRRSFTSPNCMLIDVVHAHQGSPVCGNGTYTPAAQPARAILTVDRAVLCNVKKSKNENEVYTRTTELVKNRGGRQDGWIPQPTTDLIKALIQ